ncbi:hypothetical protein HY339_02370 [Candidatus Gottesmanbacteria bacterium]|nr:hypothetical protein [Candidatus Gottesmanbacteria bacterium]
MVTKLFAQGGSQSNHQKNPRFPACRQAFWRYTCHGKRGFIDLKIPQNAKIKDVISITPSEWAFCGVMNNKKEFFCLHAVCNFSFLFSFVAHSGEVFSRRFEKKIQPQRERPSASG